MRALLVGVAVVSSACGSEALVDGRFHAAEWEFIQTFRLDRQQPVSLPCVAGPECTSLAALGSRLFRDPGLSGPILVAVDASSGGLGAIGDRGKVACSSCHDPRQWFTDTRSKPGASSLGTGWTRRNTPGLVDAIYLDSYTWTGKYGQIGDVMELALTSAAAMNTTKLEAASYLRATYVEFPSTMDDGAAVRKASAAFEVYEAGLVAGASPFDRYAAGDDVAEFPEAARRGLAVFIGRGLCSECHTGPMFSDKRFHNTGVMQHGEHAAPVDHGRAEVTGASADDGAFRTPTLRHVAKTAPYMHAGQLATLADVIDFYRWGGHPSGFAGSRDPRILPLELDDQDAADLQAFLESLTGTPVDPALTVP